MGVEICAHGVGGVLQGGSEGQRGHGTAPNEWPGPFENTRHMGWMYENTRHMGCMRTPGIWGGYMRTPGVHPQAHSFSTVQLPANLLEKEDPMGIAYDEQSCL